MNEYKYRDEMKYSNQFNELTVEESTTIKAGEKAGGMIRNFFSVANECIREIFG